MPPITQTKKRELEHTSRLTPELVALKKWHVCPEASNDVLPGCIASILMLQASRLTQRYRSFML